MRSDDRIDAGLTDGSGHAASPLAPGEWRVPEGIRLEGEYLVYRRQSPYYAIVDSRTRVRRADKAMLPRFLRLATARPERILAFVQQYGTLHGGDEFFSNDSPFCSDIELIQAGETICKVKRFRQRANATDQLCGQIVTPVLACMGELIPETAPAGTSAAFIRFLLSSAGQGGVFETLRQQIMRGEAPPPTALPFGHSFERFEPVEEWRTWSRRMQSAINILLAVWAGQPGTDADWSTIEEKETKATDRFFGTRLTVSRLQWVLNDWAKRAQLYGSLSGVAAFAPGRRQSRLFTFELNTPSVFAALVQKLLMQAAKTQRLAPCAECGRAFVPDRQPADGKRAFCPQCREDGAPQRHASRDRYRRLRAKTPEKSDGSA